MPPLGGAASLGSSTGIAGTPGVCGVAGTWVKPPPDPPLYPERIDTGSGPALGVGTGTVTEIAGDELGTGVAVTVGGELVDEPPPNDRSPSERTIEPEAAGEGELGDVVDVVDVVDTAGSDERGTNIAGAGVNAREIAARGAPRSDVDSVGDVGTRDDGGAEGDVGSELTTRATERSDDGAGAGGGGGDPPSIVRPASDSAPISRSVRRMTSKRARLRTYRIACQARKTTVPRAPTPPTTTATFLPVEMGSGSAKRAIRRIPPEAAGAG